MKKIFLSTLAASVVMTSFGSFKAKPVSAENGATVKAQRPISASERNLAKYLEKMGIKVTNYNQGLTDAEAKQMVDYLQKNPLKRSKQMRPRQRETRAGGLDTSITRLTVKMKSSSKGSFISKFTPYNSENKPYVGEMVSVVKLPMEGSIPFGIDIGGERAIQDYRKGNYGVRLIMRLPKGMDAKEAYKIIDWEKSILKTNLYVRVIGVPLPLEMSFPLKFDRSSIQFSPKTPNELSIVVRGMDKNTTSKAEWESYPQFANESLMRLAATTNIGSLSGSAEGNIYMNFSKYAGNEDDSSPDKVLTKGKLTPAENKKFEMQMFVVDRSGLTAGKAGKGNISNAEVIPGKEYAYQTTNNQIPTWREYISLWDNQQEFNTVPANDQEVIGELYDLPGKNIFERELNLNLLRNGDFNKFDPKRFDRIVDYYTKEEVTTEKK